MTSNALSLSRDDREHLSEINSLRGKTTWLPDTGSVTQDVLVVPPRPLFRPGHSPLFLGPGLTKMSGTEQEQVLMKCWSS